MTSTNLKKVGLLIDVNMKTFTKWAYNWLTRHTHCKYTNSTANNNMHGMISFYTTFHRGVFSKDFGGR